MRNSGFILAVETSSVTIAFTLTLIVLQNNSMLTSTFQKSLEQKQCITCRIYLQVPGNLIGLLQGKKADFE